MPRPISTISTRFITIFLVMGVVLSGTKLLYYYTMMAEKEHAKQTINRATEDRSLAGEIERDMLSAQTWETEATSIEAIDTLIHQVINNAARFQERFQISGDTGIKNLVATAIETINAFHDTFHVTTAALQTKGFDPNSGIHGATRQAAHNLEEILDNYDTEPLLAVFRQMEIVTTREGLHTGVDLVQAIQPLYLELMQHLDSSRLDNAHRGQIRQLVDAYREGVVTAGSAPATEEQGTGTVDQRRQLNHLAQEVETWITHHYIPNIGYDYLLARRHEKDFLSRMDEQYVDLFYDVLDGMQQKVATSKISAADKNSLFTTVHVYEQAFRTLGQQSLFVNLRQHEMRTKALEVREIMTQISAHTQADLAEHLTQTWQRLTQYIQFGLFFSIVVILVGLLVAGLLVDRSISRPIIHLTRAMTRLSHGRESWMSPTWMLTVTAQDEIGELATAFKKMVGELRRHMLAVSEAKAYTENILLSMTDTLLVVNSAGIVQKANRLELLGYNEPELVGMAVEKLFTSREGNDTGGLDHVARLRANTQTNLDATLVRKDGIRVPVLISGSRMQDRTSGESVFVLVIRDVTQIVEFQKELQTARQMAEMARDTANAANHAKSLFVANMSHEIRTPMNAIIGLTHLCLQTGLTTQQRDYLDKVRSSANNLLGILNDILDFSKIESGKLEVEIIPFYLRDILHDLATLLTVKTQGKDLEWVFVVAPDVPQQVLGDPTRLGQVLINLASNAAKFTESGEVVLSITVAKEEERHLVLQFAIRDTGIGMTPEQTGRLFQAFTQADGGTTRKYGGTGLGLTISKRLVEVMGGTIEVESAVGEGSLFRFTARFGLPDGEHKRVLCLPAELQKKRALVVDDNQTCREMLQTALESFFFTVTTVNSGMAGLLELEKKRIEGNPFDLLLLDWRMPQLDGAQTLQCLESMENPFEVPTLFMVPHIDQTEIREQLGDLHPEGFLDKPVQLSSLYDAIMILFGHAGLASVRTNAQNLDCRPCQAIAGARVLLVEDNEINQQVAKELLTMAGVVVEIASNGQEAVQRVTETEFELVLMDIQMPVLDGYQATQQIRAMPGRAGLPIVAMTANVMVQDLARCWEAGMDAHIAKPIDPKKLFHALNKWLKPRAQPHTVTNNAVPSAISAISAVSAVSASPNSLPAMSGINAEFGLSRVGGNIKLFRDLLGKFVNQYGNCAEEIRAAVAQGETQQARRMAHTLKGVAGTLGALRLQAMAWELESTLRVTTDFREELAAVLAAIHPLLATTPKESHTPSATTVVDLALLKQTLESLKPHIEKQRPKNCHPILEELAQMAIPHNIETDLANLTILIKKYKMKDALAILETMLARLSRA